MKALFFIPLLLLILSCMETDKGIAADPADKDTAAWIAQGSHLVTITGCNDCHTPKSFTPNGPQFHADRLLSGFNADQPVPDFDTLRAKAGWVQMNPDMTAAAGPWGITFAANLTQGASGAASWPFENFKRAMREGKAKGLENNRMLLPPMPWQNYAALTDDEIKAIYLYLQSIPAVENLPPQPVAFQMP